MKFREIIKNTNIDFIGMRNKTFIFSAVVNHPWLCGFCHGFHGKGKSQC